MHGTSKKKENFIIFKHFTHFTFKKKLFLDNLRKEKIFFSKF